MSATIDTIVQCDECGDQCSGDDRHLPAYRIREQRRSVGWKSVGCYDFCEKCAPKIGVSIFPKIAKKEVSRE